MAKCYVVAVDDSDGSTRAARYALDDATLTNAELKILHVLEWSPYSFLTPEELEERHKRRKDEVKRAYEAICNPLVEKLGNTSVQIHTEVRYGHVADVISQYADEVQATQIYIGRHGGGQLANRVFGSVPGTLIQISNIPVTVVP